MEQWNESNNKRKAEKTRGENRNTHEIVNREHMRHRGIQRNFGTRRSMPPSLLESQNQNQFKFKCLGSRYYYKIIITLLHVSIDPLTIGTQRQLMIQDCKQIFI